MLRLTPLQQALPFYDPEGVALGYLDHLAGNGDLNDVAAVIGFGTTQNVSEFPMFGTMIVGPYHVADAEWPGLV